MKRLWKTGICMLGMMCLMGLGGGTAGAAPAYPSTELDVPLTKAEVGEISNVVYAQVPSRGYENVALKMDIFKPKTKEAKPAIVFVTGGGFINANKDNGLQARMALAEAGYVVASIEYRVAPTAVFPQPLEDVKAAVRFLRANAAKYGIDKAHIGLFGGSAGGYLVNMAGASNGVAGFDVGEHPEESSAVQAVCSLYGLSDLSQVGMDYSPEVQKLHQSAGATEALWVAGSPVFGGKDGGVLANPEATAAANPMKYISEQTPPFLLMHGTADTVVSPGQSDLMYQALREHGIEAQRYLLRGAAHGGVYWVQPEVTKLIVDFFDAHLK